MQVEEEGRKKNLAMKHLVEMNAGLTNACSGARRASLLWLFEGHAPRPLMRGVRLLQLTMDSDMNKEIEALRKQILTVFASVKRPRKCHITQHRCEG